MEAVESLRARRSMRVEVDWAQKGVVEEKTADLMASRVLLLGLKEDVGWIAVDQLVDQGPA